MMTLEHSSQRQSMSYAEGFRVKTLAAAESETDWTVSEVDYSTSSRESFAQYDRDLSSWKTWQTSLFGGCLEFSGNWPRSGMTRNGIAYRLPILACRKAGTAFGLLPTLTASDAKQARNATAPGRSLANGQTMTDWLRLNVGRGMLHPESAEWLMGFPEGWTELEHVATQSSQPSRSGSDDV
jgi:hypothetical protein